MSYVVLCCLFKFIIIYHLTLTSYQGINLLVLLIVKYNKNKHFQPVLLSAANKLYNLYITTHRTHTTTHIDLSYLYNIYIYL